MTNYPILDLFLTILWFFAWVLWIMLLFWIIMDIFRSRDLGGWAKAGWLFVVIVLPLLGVLVYLIARGGSMHERQARAAQEQDEAFRTYVREAADGGGGHSNSDELTRLAGLRDSGVITEDEFRQAKAKILN